MKPGAAPAFLAGKLVVPALTLLLGLAPARAWAQRPAWPGPSLLAPLQLDRQEHGQIWIFPDADRRRFMLDADALFEVTRPLLTEAAERRLEQGRVPGSPVISAASLAEAGLDARFDESQLELELAIPPSVRRVVDVSLSPRPWMQGQPQSLMLGPEPFSGYLNFRGTAGLTDVPRGNGITRDPWLAGVDSFTQYQGFVLETGGDYTERSSTPWVRHDTRLIKDDPTALLRYTLGDLAYPVAGFQTFRPVGGASLTREFSIDPYRVTQPVSRSQILIKRPSSIEVYLNGAFFTRFQLAPGPFNLKDYPFVAGVNSVELRITDDLGQTETISLDFATDFELLAPGLQQFSYAVGAPSVSRSWIRDYDSRRTTASLLHRIGLTERLTLGANFQGDLDQKVGGIEVGGLTSWGFWIADVGGSATRKVSSGGVARTQFRSLDRIGRLEMPFRLSFSVDYRSSTFTPLGALAPYNPYSWSVDTYFTRALPAGVYAGVGYQWQVARQGFDNRSTARADLSRNWSHGIRSSLNYSWTSGSWTSGSGTSAQILGSVPALGSVPSSVAEHRAFFSLSWSDPGSSRGANATYDTQTSTARVDAYRNSVQPYDDYRLAAGVERTPTSSGADAQAEYLGHRGVARLSQSSHVIRGSGDSVHATQLSLGSAVAWAGSSVALSRPVTDSFVLVSAEGRPEGTSVPVNPNGTFAETEISGWGPGVLPNSASYYVQQITIDDSALGPSEFLRRSRFTVRPGFRSGVRVSLLIEHVAHLQGMLLKPDGQALGLAAGELKRQGDPEFLQPFFTNRSGQFWLEGLKSGRYEIELSEGAWKSVPIVVGVDQTGVAKLGAIRVEKKQ